MKNLSTALKKAFLIVGLTIVAILVCTPAGAGDEWTASALGGRDFHGRSNLGDNRLENASQGTGLIISLTRSLSLDLRLSSVSKGQAPPIENQSGTPPIPIPNETGSGLRYSKLGVGLRFGF